MAVFYALGPKIATDEFVHTYGYTPMILIGNKNIFGFSGDELERVRRSRRLETNLPALIFGLSIGDSFQQCLS